jgi:hypothetical protein
VTFHEHLGFAGVAEQDTDEGRKRVLLMTKQLTAPLTTPLTLPLTLPK